MRVPLRPLLLCAQLLALSCTRRPPEEEPAAGHSEGGSGATSNPASAEPRDASVPRDRAINDVSFAYDGPSDDGSVNPDTACASTAVPARPVPVDLHVVLDRSASMQQPLNQIPSCNVGEAQDSRWCHAIDALGGFFAAPTSNGMGVALDFVPHGTCTWVSPTEQNCCTFGDCCSGTSESVPAVTLGELPSHFPNLIAALNAQDPLGTTTPLEAALRGMTKSMRSTQRASRQMVGIVTTDGRPNGCERDTQALADILLRHREATGQLTFVIGMTGADYEALEQLAEAGGATPHSSHCAGGYEPCTFYDVGDGDPKAFVDALSQIQRSVVGCRFGMPTTPLGLVDTDTMIVQWSSEAEPVPQSLARVAVPSDSCHGWYAAPDKPEEFSLCATTCALLQAQPSARVDVLAGCRGA
jgi:hypothetical protein